VERVHDAVACPFASAMVVAAPEFFEVMPARAWLMPKGLPTPVPLTKAVPSATANCSENSSRSSASMSKSASSSSANET
jgi:hypothetical protein